MATIEIVSDRGDRRTLELVRFEGDSQPLAIVRWGVAGVYRLELHTNRLVGARGILLVNWRAADVDALLEQHRAWRRARRTHAKPAILKGAR